MVFCLLHYLLRVLLRLLSGDKSKHPTTLYPVFFSRQGTTAMAAPKLGAPTGPSDARVPPEYSSMPSRPPPPRRAAGAQHRSPSPPIWIELASPIQTKLYRHATFTGARGCVKPSRHASTHLRELRLHAVLRTIIWARLHRAAPCAKGPNRSCSSTPAMRLWKCSNSATPQCPPLGPVQAATLLPARCSLKCLNYGQKHIFNGEPLIIP
jgi:hypothetical protein